MKPSTLELELNETFNGLGVMQLDYVRIYLQMCRGHTFSLADWVQRAVARVSLYEQILEGTLADVLPEQARSHIDEAKTRLLREAASAERGVLVPLLRQMHRPLAVLHTGFHAQRIGPGVRYHGRIHAPLTALEILMFHPNITALIGHLTRRSRISEAELCRRLSQW